MTVHDRLGQPGGAGRVQHPQRVAERDLDELRLAVTGRSREVGPAERAHPRLAGRGPGGRSRTRGGTVRGNSARPVHHDHGGQPGQPGDDLADRLVPAELLAAVAVAAHREQHRGADLREPVDHAVRAEIRRAGRPDGAQAGRGQQADDRFGDVRQERGHPVPLADAERTQGPADPSHFGGQLTVGAGPRWGVLGAGDDRGAGGIGAGRAQRVPRVVQRGARKPAGLGQLPAQRRTVAALAEDAEILPQRVPERARLGRPTTPRDPGSQRRRRRDARPASAGTG